ncbi:MAG: hypothetical protein ACTSR3_18340, partial [Candidatus Helarchaeota archaeon]
KTSIDLQGDEQGTFWQYNGIPICTATNGQNETWIIGDGAGGAFVAWMDYRDYGTTGVDIYVQKINSTGHSQWQSNGLLVCNALNDQRYPKMCSDGAGGIIITWDDFRTGSSDIYAQRVNSTGHIVWTSNGTIICNAVNQQYVPYIISDGTGGAFIAWLDGRINMASADIYAQRVNSSGHAQWAANGVIVCNAPNGQYDPQMCSDGSGGAIIIWSDRRVDPNYDVYAQRFDSSGNMLWAPNGTPICTELDTMISIEAPSIVSDNSGGAIIIWDDSRTGAILYVYAQKINSSGNIQWTANGTRVSGSAGHAKRPELCSDGLGGAIITWDDSRGSSSDIYVQYINSSGNLQWGTSGLAVCTATDHQIRPEICSDGMGGAIIAWEDLRGPNYDIYVQWVNSTGNIKWEPNGSAVCTASSDQKYLTIDSDGQGGAIIVWPDYRSGSDSDIYAQKVRDIEPPSTNHPSDVITQPSGSETIDWVLQDQTGAGKYRVWANDSNGVYYIWSDWQDWNNNTNLQVSINRTAVGKFNYTIEYNNSGGIFGNPDTVIVYVSTGPTSNNLVFITTYTTSSQTIGWILWDSIGPGKYRVWVNDTNNNYYVWQDWTEWQNNTDLQVPINRTAVGKFNYTIEYNNSVGIFGNTDSVIVEVVARSGGQDNNGILVLLLLLIQEMEQPLSSAYIIIVISAIAVAIAVTIVIIYKRQ